MEAVRGPEIVGEYAEWEHRYDEIVSMMREAVRIDDQDARAHAQLGLNLIRNGDVKPNVPIVMLTSSNDEKSLVSGLRRGADAYLTKPIRARELLECIDRVLNLMRERDVF